jgi:hypothetical protein
MRQRELALSSNIDTTGDTTGDDTGDEVAGAVRWAGVDWSWSEHAVCVIDDAGAAIARFSVAHTAPGLANLVTAAPPPDRRGRDRTRRRAGRGGLVRGRSEGVCHPEPAGQRPAHPL